jgi:hypothetical protein
MEIFMGAQPAFQTGRAGMIRLHFVTPDRHKISLGKKMKMSAVYILFNSF